jgi:hypothetical protein
MKYRKKPVTVEAVKWNGYKCKYGNFEEVILSPKHARQIYGLYRFLMPFSPEELKKIVNKD